MGWLIGCTIIYVAVIAAMCWSSANKTKKPSNKEMKEFIEKHTKRY